MGCAHHGKGDSDLALIALRRTMRIATQQQSDQFKPAQAYIQWVLTKNNKNTDNPIDIPKYQDQLIDSIKHEIQGDTLQSKNKPQAALEAYQQAVDLEIAAVGTSHIDLADLWVKMAKILQQNKKKKKAAELLDQAAELYQRSFGDDHVYTTRAINLKDAFTPAASKQDNEPVLVENGNSQRKTPSPRKKRNRKVNDALKQQVSASDLVKSKEHSCLVDQSIRHFQCQGDYAGRYFWMAMGFHMNDQSQQSLVAFRRAWRLRDAVYGREHSQTRHVLGWISDVVMESDIGNVRGYRRDLFESVDRERHGDQLFEDQKHMAALREYQRAAALEEESVGTYHLEFADLKRKIGDLQAQREQYEWAMADYKSALLIYNSAYGRKHEATKEIFRKMDSMAKSRSIMLSQSTHVKKSNKYLSPLKGRKNKGSLGFSTHHHRKQAVW